MADKLKLAKLRSLVMKRNGGSPMAEAPTMQFLREFGFSSRMIELFFRPFLGGIFLERELDTASRMFAFVFRMFSLGEAALPAAGMGAIAEQLAGQLPADWVRLRQRVVKVEPGSVAISTGEEIKGSAIVVATDRANAAKLLPEIGPAPWRATTCFYFAAEKAPVPEPILVLNGDGRGPINNLCVPSLVAPSYAPSGVHLVSASVVGGSKVAPEQLLREVKKQLAEWFGDEARSWRHLRTDWIPNALPEPLPGKTATFRPGIYVCGDYRETASINGALESGRKTAEAVLERRQR
jgi:phytoene dehydrogenase-like protein